MVSFPYRRESSRLLGEVLRPVASVQIRSAKGEWFHTLMYVDSGADLSLIPRDFGKLLGMNLNQNRGSIAGVSGAQLGVSVQSTGVRIGNTVIEAKIAIAMKNDVPYLLGRDSIFRLFRIVFEEYRSRVRFDPPM